MCTHYLSSAEKEALLKLARQSIASRLEGVEPPQLQDISGLLAEPGAAFVTIRINGELRGCIGYTEAFRPLHQTVAGCALASAFEDPRFSPLTAGEYQRISIEISVLTPLRRIESPEQVVTGKHGLLIAAQGQRGLLLPQVATENDWDRETFLGYTCLKAGLPREAWKSPETEIYVFEAEVFAEADFA